VSAAAATPVPSVTLNDGAAMPRLGLGVFRVPPAETERIVSDALEVGYRSIDTAAAYRNEPGVGRAIARSGIPRSEIFVTTKLANPEQGRARTLAAFEASLDELGLEYVDLYLIHWPVPQHDLYVESWETLIEIATSGRARSIGVSNFNAEHLERIIAESGRAPAVNQIELHPGLTQQALRELNASHGVVTESWSPLAAGDQRVLEHPLLGELAGMLGKTPAQVILRWHIQLGCVAIPKASSPARMRENMELFDFELDDAQMARIGAIEAGGRMGPDPDTFFAP
jgi:2,5-diketo-D-gluconate reductase A